MLAVADADQHRARRRLDRQGPLNVGRVLQARLDDQVSKLVLPSSLPLIFTGLRLSLGVGWMVLIAAEMLAQNPGLGKFVWDEFQNGSSSRWPRIMVAVFTIGIIGFLLDRVMLALQAAFTYGASALRGTSMAFLELEGVSQELWRGAPAPTSCTTSTSSRGGRVRRHRRLLGQRQDHADLAARRPAQARRGEVLLKGSRSTGPGPERGVVFQTYSLMPWLTVVGQRRAGGRLPCTSAGREASARR